MIDSADLDELNPAAGASLAIALLACCLIVCCSVLRMLCSCTEALRDKLHEVIFEADTLGGKVFDVSLLVAILASVSTVLAESVHEYRTEYGRAFRTAELSFTGLFAVEYALRLVAVQRPLAYALSFFGVVDLLSIVPTFLESFVPGATHLRAIRVLRLLRVFRVLKLVGFLSEAHVLWVALREARRKILVFLTTVMVVVTLLGTLLYMVEDHNSGFTSIPRSIYWAIVRAATSNLRVALPPFHRIPTPSTGHGHHRWVWRHCAADRPRPSDRLCHHDDRLRHHRRRRRHLPQHRRLGAARGAARHRQATLDEHARLPRVRRRGPRRRRRLLQVLRRAAAREGRRRRRRSKPLARVRQGPALQLRQHARRPVTCVSCRMFCTCPSLFHI